MSEFKKTRIEISGQGDIELLDYALRNLGVGEVERSFRLFNVEKLENVQLSFTLNGKKRVWQPFRAEFKRNAAGNFTVLVVQTVFYACEVIKQAGWTAGNIVPGDYPDMGRPAAGMKISGSYSLNGRKLSVIIDTSNEKGDPKK